MKTFNFHIPAPLRERLSAERERTGLAEAEIVRRALDEHLEQREDRRGERTVKGRDARARAV
jgi:predicted DNA-binding protein